MEPQEKFPKLKNNTPYTVVEEEQYKIGLTHGAIVGMGIGLLGGIIATMAIFFFLVL